MVLWVNRYSILADKVAAYTDWAESAMRRLLAGPGVVEFRGYRAIAGSSQVMTTFEFDDLAAWARWRDSEEVRKVHHDLRAFVEDYAAELWGPSPIVSSPVRPR